MNIFVVDQQERITQIANATKIPILHTVEIIDWYTGGPKPQILKKI